MYLLYIFDGNWHICERGNARLMWMQMNKRLQMAGGTGAGERGGSLLRTDAAQIRGNVVLVPGDGMFERREPTTRTRELKRPK